MNISISRNKVRTIRQDDPRFFIQDGLYITPRAGFEIDQQCPENYKIILATCIDNGWLKPVAHVSEKELIFLGLQDQKK